MLEGRGRAAGPSELVVNTFGFSRRGSLLGADRTVVADRSVHRGRRRGDGAAQDPDRFVPQH